MVVDLQARDDSQEAAVPLEPAPGIVLGDDPTVLLPLLVRLPDFSTPLVDLSVVRFRSSEVLCVVEPRRGDTRRGRKGGQKEERRKREGREKEERRKREGEVSKGNKAAGIAWKRTVDSGSPDHHSKGRKEDVSEGKSMERVLGAHLSADPPNRRAAPFQIACSVEREN
jgi:hypothetical protein